MEMGQGPAKHLEDVREGLETAELEESGFQRRRSDKCSRERTGRRAGRGAEASPEKSQPARLGHGHLLGLLGACSSSNLQPRDLVAVESHGGFGSDKGRQSQP